MTMRERIEDLRDWASTRARLASSAHTESMEEIEEQLLLAKLEKPVQTPEAVAQPDTQAEAEIDKSAVGISGEGGK